MHSYCHTDTSPFLRTDTTHALAERTRFCSRDAVSSEAKHPLNLRPKIRQIQPAPTDFVKARTLVSKVPAYGLCRYEALYSIAIFSILYGDLADGPTR